MEILSSASDGITGQRAISRLLGGTELNWCRAVPGGTGITVFALLLSNSFPLPLLRSSLRRLQVSHPLLRAYLPSASLGSSGGPSPPILISPFPLDKIEIIPSDLLPSLSAAIDEPPVSVLHSVVEHEMNRNPWAEPADGQAVGSFFSTIYELPESEQSILALRFHTAVCDRTSGFVIVKELTDLLREGEGGEDNDEEQEGEILLAVEDLINKEDSWKPFWARGKDLIGYSLNGLRSSSLRFEDASSRRNSAFVRLVIDVEETRRLLAVCQAKGVKLCSALTAAGLLATYASKSLASNQSEIYSVITLIDCRKDLNLPLNNKHVGFYHSAISNTHTIRSGEELWEVAIRCHNAYANAKKNKKHLTDIGDLNFLMCKAMENPHLTPASSLRTALISIFEETMNYDELFEQLQELGIEDYMECSSVHGIGASVAIFDTVRKGQLDCACVYPSPLHSRKQMLEFVENVKRILQEGCCGVDGGFN